MNRYKRLYLCISDLLYIQDINVYKHMTLCPTRQPDGARSPGQALPPHPAPEPCATVYPHCLLNVHPPGHVVWRQPPPLLAALTTPPPPRAGWPARPPQQSSTHGIILTRSARGPAMHAQLSAVQPPPPPPGRPAGRPAGHPPSSFCCCPDHLSTMNFRPAIEKHTYMHA